MTDNTPASVKSKREELKELWVNGIQKRLITKIREIKNPDKDLNSTSRLQDTGYLQKRYSLISIAKDVLEKSARAPNTTLESAESIRALLMQFAELEAELEKENDENVMNKSASAPNTTLVSAKSNSALLSQLAALEIEWNNSKSALEPRSLRRERLKLPSLSSIDENVLERSASAPTSPEASDPVSSSRSISTSAPVTGKAGIVTPEKVATVTSKARIVTPEKVATVTGKAGIVNSSPKQNVSISPSISKSAPVTGKARIVTQEEKVATSKLPVSAPATRRNTKPTPPPLTPSQNRTDAEKAKSTESGNRHEAAAGPRGALQNAGWTAVVGKSTTKNSNEQNQLAVNPKAKSTESGNRHAAAAGLRDSLRKEKVGKLTAQNAGWTAVVGKSTTKNSNEHEFPYINPVFLKGSLPGNLATRSNFADSINCRY
jgi:hypothetical protein